MCKLFSISVATLCVITASETISGTVGNFLERDSKISNKSWTDFDVTRDLYMSFYVTSRSTNLFENAEIGSSRWYILDE